MFGFLCFFPLVIGSRGVAVTEVITCIAERLIVTEWANHR